MISKRTKSARKYCIAARQQVFVGIVHDQGRQKLINPKTGKGRIFSYTDRKSDRMRVFFRAVLVVSTENKIKSLYVQ